MAHTSITLHLKEKRGRDTMDTMDEVFAYEEAACDEEGATAYQWQGDFTCF
jgi:hypothetical protein